MNSNTPTPGFRDHPGPFVVDEVEPVPELAPPATYKVTISAVIAEAPSDPGGWDFDTLLEHLCVHPGVVSNVLSVEMVPKDRAIQDVNCDRCGELITPADEFERWGSESVCWDCYAVVLKTIAGPPE